MSTINPIWIEGQRNYRLRPNAQRFIRHDAHRFMTPDPNSHRSYASRLLEQRRAEEKQTACDAEVKQLYRDHLALRRQLAHLKSELAWRRLCRKYGYNPGQPRDGRGRWTDAGGGPANTGTLSLTADSQSANAVGTTDDKPASRRAVSAWQAIRRLRISEYIRIQPTRGTLKRGDRSTIGASKRHRVSSRA